MLQFPSLDHLPLKLLELPDQFSYVYLSHFLDIINDTFSQSTFHAFGRDRIDTFSEFLSDKFLFVP